MRRLVPIVIAAIAGLGTITLPPATGMAKGVQTPPPWDLETQYPDEMAWNTARKSVDDSLALVAGWRDRPLQSARDLADLMDAVAFVRGRAGAMARFALLKASSSARSDTARARYSATTALESRVDAATAWVDAAVRKLGERQVQAWSAEDRRLSMHSWRIAIIFRQSGHVEPAGAEPLAAALERATEAPLDLYRAVLTSDLSWPSVTTSKGRSTVDFLNYSDLRRDPRQETRDEVNRAYFQRLKDLEQPLGLLLVRRFEMERDLARARHFDNGIDAFFALDDGIPPGSYRRIFQSAQANKAVAVRYLKLLARMNGVSKPGLGELYAPPPANTAPFSVVQVLNDVVEAWGPVGASYQRLMAERLKQPWMDLAPSADKDGSAGGVYWAVGGGHPYTFLKFQGDLPSAELLSAAVALTMFYADLPANKRPERREEDFPVYSNAIWFAGELLYDDHLLSKATGRQQRIAILSSQLYRMWNAYFQFAITTELEDEIGRAVDNGDEVSGRDISQRYLAILSHFYADPGIEIDPLFAEQWMTYPFIFDSRHILPEWAMAMGVGAELVGRLEAHDERAIAAIRTPLLNATSFASYDVARDAGVEIDGDVMYQSVVLKMNTDMDLLEKDLSN
jgi:oligoendopeptidase F